MTAQGFGDRCQLFERIRNDLESNNNLAIYDISGKKVNMSRVVAEFGNQITDPNRSAEFLRYGIVWLYNNRQANSVNSRPTDAEYERAWDELRLYPNAHQDTQAKLQRSMARLGEHLILRCIYPGQYILPACLDHISRGLKGIILVMARMQSTPGSHESTQPRTHSLWADCLSRDGNRCVVTGAFNLDDLERRAADYLDDDNRPLLPNAPGSVVHFEVAHIIPHALGWEADADEAAVSSCLHSSILLTLNRFKRD